MTQATPEQVQQAEQTTRSMIEAIRQTATPEAKDNMIARVAFDLFSHVASIDTLQTTEDGQVAGVVLDNESMARLLEGLNVVAAIAGHEIMIEQMEDGGVNLRLVEIDPAAKAFEGAIVTSEPVTDPAIIAGLEAEKAKQEAEQAAEAKPKAPAKKRATKKAA